MQADIERLGLNVDWERTGMLTVATEPHQVEWLAEGADDGDGRFLDQAAVRAEVNSPTYQAGLFAADTCAIVHPARLVFELARACTEAGVQIFEHTAALAGRRRNGVRVSTGAVIVTDARLCWPPTSFPACSSATGCTPSRCTTTCWPPSHSRRPSWTASAGVAAGIGDSANQFHYYRLSADNRIVWGGYDAVYHFGRRVDPMYEDRPETYRRLAAHFFITFPQLDDVRFSHRWAGAIDTNTRFCAHWGLAGRGRIAYVNGFTGLGVGAARFAADVCLDLLDGQSHRADRAGDGQPQTVAVPARTGGQLGIQATRWSLDRADHTAGKRNVFLRTLDRLGLGFDS